MSRGLDRHNLINLVALALLIISLLGPWATSSDGVPPPEWCATPNFLLDNDRCVRYMPGTEIFSLMFGIILAIGTGFITRTSIFSSQLSFTDLLRELVFLLLFAMLLQPFLNLLALSWGADTQKKRMLRAVTWGLAVIPAALLGVSETFSTHLGLWGVWLYIMVTVGMLVLEITMLYATIHKNTSP